MITYNLSCSRGHEFEGWFKDSAAYDAQETGGALVCPMCGDLKIRKAIMSPSVSKSSARAPAKTDAETVRQYAAGLRKFIQKNAEYVGPRFADEARKIHYGEVDERHIYGESTTAEVKELIKEGIEVAPFPVDPEEMN
nr:MAG: DUF1178 family protein [Hyphomicrobiales bacterium]